MLWKEGSMLLNPNLIEKNDRLIVAVSGGVDSMVMLDCLNNLKDKLNLFLVVVHINHHKREA
ncbi:MAG: tRNA(Ile)-lysidine synthetase, partial [Acholeplasmataceae bacterium]|nr:tRNA(Ile)-lysidine synthetase [Acholeplasmataceae bacterium]